MTGSFFRLLCPRLALGSAPPPPRELREEEATEAPLPRAALLGLGKGGVWGGVSREKWMEMEGVRVGPIDRHACKTTKRTAPRP